MIRITGDMHGQQARLLQLMRDYEWGTDDYLIIAGDFGFLFCGDAAEQEFLDHLGKEFPATIAFVDGNHESFDLIFSYPIEEWHGGKIHRIRRNIIHFIRGQVFVIEGKKLFAMGGAYSTDRYRRQQNVSYWEEELPENADYIDAVKNLYKHGYDVDIVVTHTAPAGIIRRMGEHPHHGDAELTGFLDWLAWDKLNFRYWYFGHWHRDKEIDERFTALWYDVKELE